jgi:hypothetical protein
MQMNPTRVLFRMIDVLLVIRISMIEICFSLAVFTGKRIHVPPLMVASGARYKTHIPSKNLGYRLRFVPSPNSSIVLSRMLQKTPMC